MFPHGRERVDRENPWILLLHAFQDDLVHSHVVTTKRGMSSSQWQDYLANRADQKNEGPLARKSRNSRFSERWWCGCIVGHKLAQVLLRKI